MIGVLFFSQLYGCDEARIGGYKQYVVWFNHLTNKKLKHNMKKREIPPWNRIVPCWVRACFSKFSATHQFWAGVDMCSYELMSRKCLDRYLLNTAWCNRLYLSKNIYDGYYFQFGEIKSISLPGDRSSVLQKRAWESQSLKGLL